MTHIDYIFLVGDFLVAIGLVVGFKWAISQGRISHYYYKLFWIGTLIGATWEFAFLFLGPDFLHSVKEWPYGLGGWPRKISHSIWDGGIFMVGIYFCEKYLKNLSFLLSIIVPFSFMFSMISALALAIPLIFLLIAVYSISNLALRENMDEFEKSLENINSIDTIK